MTAEGLGLHRVLVASRPDQESAENTPRSPGDVHLLTQGAWSLNNHPAIDNETELLLQVDLLELDSTSMRQLRQEAEKRGRRTPAVSSAGEDVDDDAALKSLILEVIRVRGKMHNPVTNSGGVLVGRPLTAGARSPHRGMVNSSHRVVPLCSLSAIPLKVESINKIHGNQVLVSGATAVVFARMQVVPLPIDLDVRLALSAIDVSRLLPQLRKLIAPFTVQLSASPAGPRAPRVALRIAILGCGVAGQCCAAFLRHNLPSSGEVRIVALDVSPRSLATVSAFAVPGLSTFLLKNGGSVMEGLTLRETMLDGVGADLVLNCVSAAGTEALSTVLCAERGTIVYFSMATNFGTAVLSTDPTGADVNVVCGAGVYPTQAVEAFHLLGNDLPLLSAFALNKGLHDWMPSKDTFKKSLLRRFVQFAVASGAVPALADLVSAKLWARDMHAWYDRLFQWSIADAGMFWTLLWRFFDVAGQIVTGDVDPALPSSRYLPPPQPTSALSEARFFPSAKVNLAQNLLRHRGGKSALIWRSEGDLIPRRVLSYDDLHSAVFRAILVLKPMGVKKGDRVGSLLPNIPEAVIFMLAATSLGAVWTAVSPDSGPALCRDRLGRVHATVLVATPHYLYNGKVFSCEASIRSLKEDALKTPVGEGGPYRLNVVLIEYVHANIAAKAGATPMARDLGDVTWSTSDRLTDKTPQYVTEFTPITMQDPVYVMYTSGTTGAPKAIAQGFGVHLNHLKETGLHLNISGEDNCFVITTCAWMLWHWMVSLLHYGCRIVLYDGHPTPPQNPLALWSFVAEEKLSFFGVSARFLEHAFLSRKDFIGSSSASPKHRLDLSTLRLITSTGSPLSDDVARFFMRDVNEALVLPLRATNAQKFGDRLRVNSISGGTEINGCLCLGCPVLPVTANELQCAPLGMDVDVIRASTKQRLRGATPLGATATPNAAVVSSLVRPPNEQGELVCFNPFPSMPVFFYNDEGGKRYRTTYFDEFGPRVWAHGDVAERACPSAAPSLRGVMGMAPAASRHSGFYVRGRSDATLNPGGVRLGTSEYYDCLKGLSDVIADALAVEMNGVGVLLFVVPAAGLKDAKAIVPKIRDHIRRTLSPKHVPTDIIMVPAVPYNRNFKKMEILVKRVMDAPPAMLFAGATKDTKTVDQLVATLPAEAQKLKELMSNLQDANVMGPFFEYKRKRHAAKV